MRVCKICGKEYEYCHTAKLRPGTFHWQDVACCEEHGMEYLAAVLKARGESLPESEPKEEEVDNDLGIKIVVVDDDYDLEDGDEDDDNDEEDDEDDDDDEEPFA